MKKKTYIFVFALISGIVTGCEGPLEEEVFSQIGPSNFYQSREDAVALLNAAYAEAQMQGNTPSGYYLLLNELCTEIMFDRGGGLERTLKPFEDFTWDATHPYFQGIWRINYRVISRANLLMDHLPDIPMNDETRQALAAEARFLRAVAYYYLYDLFGPVPLILTSEVSVSDRPARAGEEEMVAFIEAELSQVADLLPAQQEVYGRATGGAAMGLLCKFYLNQKNWQQASETAKEIMDSDRYALFDSEKRTDLFKVENERNPEFIFVRPYLPIDGIGLVFLPRAAPPQYAFEYPPKEIFATNYKIYSAFYDSFHPDDERREALITEYVNTQGETVVLGEDDVRSFKYQEDPDGVARWAGNDVPVVRYADILLSRAEALNELNGPNQESIDLINQVREKAGVPLLSLADFSGQEALKGHILNERAWEFFNEEMRRQDLIRHGRFIQMAQERGKAARDYHVRYPIPQTELDKNPNLEQNPGYAGG